MPVTRESLKAQLTDHLGDRFRMVEELGFGGMAVVYLAENLDFGRLVALKVLRPDRQLDDEVAVRFRSEAIAIAQLRHPHIIGIHARGEDGGLIWFEMDYIEGGSLEERMAAGLMDWTLICRLLAQAADGLGYAHTQGIIHRDIKPSNLLLAPSGDHLTITDFGIAKILGRTTLTETGVTLGTIAYMSPEQLVADREITGATDQYSLGVVAYEALAGKRPFPGDTAGQVRFIKSTTTPSPLQESRPDCPPDLQLLVARMLSPDPADRWPDLSTIKRAAEEIALLGESPYLRGAPAAQPRRREVRRRSPIVLATAAVVVVTGGALLLNREKPAIESSSSPAAVEFITAGPPPESTDEGTTTVPTSRAGIVVVATPPPPPPRKQAARTAPEPSLPLRTPATAHGVSPSAIAPALDSDTIAAPPASAVAVLHIATQVPGTFVYINGDDTPYQLSEGWRRFEVPAGEVRLRIRKDGCTDRFYTIKLNPGDDRSLRRTANCPDSIP